MTRLAVDPMSLVNPAATRSSEPSSWPSRYTEAMPPRSTDTAIWCHSFKASVEVESTAT